MNQSSNALDEYTRRIQSYLRFVRLMGYPQGLRAFFLHSDLLRSNLRVLDAGCGSGIATLALREALLMRKMSPGEFHGFDLTPRMLEAFRETLKKKRIEGIDLVQCDVLALNTLPPDWTGYDLIISSAMMEYLPRETLVDTLAALRTRLNQNARLVLFISRRNLLMQPLIGRWWHAHLYSAEELQDAFRRAGFSAIVFGKFPFPFNYLSLWGHIVQAS